MPPSLMARVLTPRISRSTGSPSSGNRRNFCFLDGEVCGRNALNKIEGKFRTLFIFLQSFEFSNDQLGLVAIIGMANLSFTGDRKFRCYNPTERFLRTVDADD